MKYTITKSALFAAALSAALLLGACTGNGDGQFDITESVSGHAIVSAEELAEFIEEGGTDTATILAPINLGGEMLRLSKTRGPVTLKGNNVTISGTGDCVLRLDEDCSLTLDGVTISGAANGIGCLGDAQIGGSGAEIDAVTNAIYCAGKLTVAAGSSLSLHAAIGSGIKAQGIVLGKAAQLTAFGAEHAVYAYKKDLELEAGAVLNGATDTSYNAVKVTKSLVLRDGSEFTVSNNGQYHGAEIESLAVDGVAVINAKGGEHGVGLFVYTQRTDIYVLGSCSPDARYENGSGEIVFCESAAEVTNAQEAQAAEAAAEQAALEAQAEAEQAEQENE